MIRNINGSGKKGLNYKYDPVSKSAVLSGCECKKSPILEFNIDPNNTNLRIEGTTVISNNRTFNNSWTGRAITKKAITGPCEISCKVGDFYIAFGLSTDPYYSSHNITNFIFSFIYFDQTPNVFPVKGTGAARPWYYNLSNSLLELGNTGDYTWVTGDEFKITLNELSQVTYYKNNVPINSLPISVNYTIGTPIYLVVVTNENVAGDSYLTNLNFKPIT